MTCGKHFMNLVHVEILLSTREYKPSFIFKKIFFLWCSTLNLIFPQSSLRTLHSSCYHRWIQVAMVTPSFSPHSALCAHGWLRRLPVLRRK